MEPDINYESDNYLIPLVIQNTYKTWKGVPFKYLRPPPPLFHHFILKSVNSQINSLFFNLIFGPKYWPNNLDRAGIDSIQLNT